MVKESFKESVKTSGHKSGYCGRNLEQGRERSNFEEEEEGVSPSHGTDIFFLVNALIFGSIGSYIKRAVAGLIFFHDI